MTEACPELAPLLAARPLGVLEDAEIAKLDAHTKECERCTAFARELESALATAKPEARPAPPAAWEKIAQRIEQDRAERLATDDLITPVKVSLNCMFCHEGLSSREAVYCASCLAPHHGDCFEEHGRCSALGCGETRTVAPRTAPPKRRPVDGRKIVWIGLASTVAAAAAVAALHGYEAKERKAAVADSQRELATENAKLKAQIALLRAQAALAANQRQYAESIGLLTHALELDSSVAELWSERGVIKEDTGDRAGALGDFMRAIELDPRVASSWRRRAHAELELGRTEDAIADLTRAIELAPKVAEGWGSRGEAKASRGDFAQAHADYETALKLTADAAYRTKVLDLERALAASSGPPVKVLLIEGWPRRDFQFIARALRNDAGVLFQAWLMSADPGAEQEHSNNEERDQDTLERYGDFFASLRAVPRTAGELARYDVIVLGDVNVRELAPGFAETLAAFAIEGGGGLVFLAGEKDYLSSLRGTALEPLLPIVPIASAPVNGTFTERLRIGLTTAGVASPITRLRQDAARNATLWDGGLPAPYWVAPVASVREDATVLVRTAIDNRPVFVTRTHRRAHVLVSLTDETWRWRAGAGDELMGAFWKNVFTWARKADPLARPGYLGIQLVDNEGFLGVVQVFPDSPAAQALGPGDRILALNRTPHSTLETFRDALSLNAPGTKILLTVERGGVTFGVEVTLGDPPKEK